MATSSLSPLPTTPAPPAHSYSQYPHQLASLQQHLWVFHPCPQLSLLTLIATLTTLPTSAVALWPPYPETPSYPQDPHHQLATISSKTSPSSLSLGTVPPPAGQLYSTSHSCNSFVATLADPPVTNPYLQHHLKLAYPFPLSPPLTTEPPLGTHLYPLYHLQLPLPHSPQCLQTLLWWLCDLTSFTCYSLQHHLPLRTLTYNTSWTL